MKSSSNVQLDNQHPWPGLQSFSTSNRTHFRGRDEETHDLTRRLKREMLTVLFGVSGLGKTSLLQAGLIPALDGTEFTPVFVRLDPMSEHSLLEQTRVAIKSAMEKAGITRSRAPHQGEDLWCFFHRKDLDWYSPDGELRNAVLIFDQFEEIFTRTRANAESETTRRYFLNELAALVENRPSEETRDFIDQQTELLDQFDFAQEDYRIVLSLREDYLPELEDLKRRMPSVMNNRLRLARFDERQALDAVLGPGKEIVEEPVAREIVRFVAGSLRGDAGNGRSRHEVDPALLSLVCSELNAQRLAENAKKITSELLQGRTKEILNEYYARCFEFLLPQQRPLARAFVEDNLLTGDGHRDSLALEEAEREVAGVGMPAGTIDRLVDQRLLQFDERHGLRRVELTHDVLTEVVGKSRLQRRELEKLEEQRKVELAEIQRAKDYEQSAQSQLILVRRQRQRYAVAGALFAVLFVAALYFAIKAQGQNRELLKQKDVLHRQQEELQKSNEGRAAALTLSEANLKAVEKITDRFTGQLLDEIAQTKGTQVMTLQRIVKNGLSAYRELPDKLRGTPTVEHNHAQLLRIAAEIAINIDPLGNFKAAKDSVELAAGALEQVAEKDRHLVELDLVDAYTTLGEIQRRHVRVLPADASVEPLLQGARESYERALQFARQHRERASLDDVPSCLAVAVTLARQGDLLKERWSYTKANTRDAIAARRQLLLDALKLYQESFELCSTLHPKEPEQHEQVQRMFADLHNKMGAAYGAIILAPSSHNEDDFAEARKHFMESKRIRQTLVNKDPEAVLDKQQLSYTINNIGWINQTMRKFAEASKNYTERLRLSTEIASSDPHNFSYQLDQAEAYRHIAVVQRLAKPNEGGNPKAAIKNYQAAVDVTDGKSAFHLEELISAADDLKDSKTAAEARRRLGKLKTLPKDRLAEE